MPNLRDIKRRIRSVKNTGKITRAMQLVAASKMKRAQDAAIAARPYAQLLADMLAVLPHAAAEAQGAPEPVQAVAASEEAAAVDHSHDGLEHPMLRPRPVRRRGVLLLSTDKGLAGALNSNLFRTVAADFDRENTRFVAVGRKGAQFLSRTGRTVVAQFSVGDRAPYSQVRPVVETLVQAYLKGEIDTIEVVYPRFINNLRQEATVEQLAPIPDLKSFIAQHRGRAQYTKDAPNPDDEREMKFEPSPREIVGALVELYVRREIYQMVLEAQASEHSARMVAMKTATDNAKELASRLTLKYNKARQAAITQEILEISAATADA